MIRLGGFLVVSTSVNLMRGMTSRTVLAIAIGIPVLVLVLQARTVDGVGGFLCLEENTRYPPGYSEVAFRMTEQDARSLINDPLKTFDFTYSTSGVDRALYYRTQPGWYRLRTLLLYRGRVVKIAAECTGD